VINAIKNLMFTYLTPTYL